MPTVYCALLNHLLYFLDTYQHVFAAAPMRLGRTPRVPPRDWDNFRRGARAAAGPSPDTKRRQSRSIVLPTLIDTGIDPGTAAPIDTETTYPRPFRASWTRSPDRTMMCSYP
jgi:hypothetical protein